MIERRMGLLGALLVLAQAGMFWGCSSSSESTPSTGGSPGTGGTSSGTTGGTSSGTTGGTSSGTTGGTSSGTTGGTTSVGGAATCAMQVLPTVAAACKGISTNTACTAEGQACPMGLCGIADTGRRDCNCATNWSCTSCNYDSSPFKCPPANLPACTTEAKTQPCTTACAVCDKGTDICACYWDDEGVLAWDCDKKPTSWAACP